MCKMNENPHCTWVGPVGKGDSGHFREGLVWNGVWTGKGRQKGAILGEVLRSVLREGLRVGVGEGSQESSSLLGGVATLSFAVSENWPLITAA